MRRNPPVGPMAGYAGANPPAFEHLYLWSCTKITKPRAKDLVAGRIEIATPWQEGAAVDGSAHLGHKVQIVVKVVQGV